MNVISQRSELDLRAGVGTDWNVRSPKGFRCWLNRNRDQLLIVPTTGKANQNHGYNDENKDANQLPDHASSWDRARRDAHCGWVSANVFNGRAKCNSALSQRCQVDGTRPFLA